MNTDEIINRIRSIVRLARRAGTDGERVAAENAAKRLADKHGIALDTIEVTDADATAKAFEDESVSTAPSTEMGFITHILRKHFGIIVIQARIPGAQKAKLTWIGTAINVDIAKHVYTVLLRACRKDWGEARIEKRRARDTAIDWRTPYAERRAIVKLRNLKQMDFYNGWFAMIDKKLTENPLRNDTEQFETEKRAAEQKLNEIREKERINEKRHNKRDYDPTSLALGIAAGSQMNLNRPCESNGYAGPVKQIA